MGKFQPKPYKVKRNGQWVTITPEPRDINEKSFFRGIGKGSKQEIYTKSYGK